jgi:hypothetical protein
MKHQWHFSKVPKHRYVKATPANESLGDKLNVPNMMGPTVASPPADVVSDRQQMLGEKNNLPYRTPDGYERCIIDPKTEVVYDNAYSKGEITERGGVLWAGTRQFKRQERAAQFRTQHSLPDMRYVSAFSDMAKADPKNYNNVEVGKIDYRLMKKGDPWINGHPYIPKALMLREQPVMELFRMSGDDPRKPVAEDLPSDLNDPQNLTLANDLNEDRSFIRRVDIGNKLQNAKASWIRSSRIRLIKHQGEYGETLPGFPASVSVPSNAGMMRPLDISAHRKKIMEHGITHHPLRGMMGAFTMGGKATNPEKSGLGTSARGHGSLQHESYAPTPGRSR